MLKSLGPPTPGATAVEAPSASPVCEERLRRDGFVLGEWRVEPRRQRIVSPNGVRRLDPKQLDVLIALALAPGGILTRDELLEAVWKETFVNENTLSQAISRLRRALGDDSADPRYIETLNRSGYRLAAPVETLGAPVASPAQADAARRRPLSPLGVLAAGLIVGLVAARLNPPPTPAPAPGPPRPELTLPGTQASPRLSPDGAYVAFSWQSHERAEWNVWVKTIGGDEPVPLGETTEDEHLPTWSPDGRRIAFVRVAPQRRECGLFARPLIGGTEERLADCQPGMRSMAWSPDGRSLVHDGHFDPAVATRALFTLDLQTGMRRQLTTPPGGTPGDRNARFSPDGTLLAFEREVSDWRDDVTVLSLADGRLRTLTDDSWGQVRGVDWTEDGEAVLFASNRTGRFALWSAPLAGGEPTALPIHDAWVTQPSVSRDGGRLIYRTFRDSVDLWELPLDAEGGAAGEPVRHLASSRRESQPAESPRGDALAFVSDRGGSTELWSGGLDGAGLMRHTDLRGPLPASPAWSPDGERILYDAAVDGQADLWLVDRGSRRPRRLTNHPSDERNGTFSRDGATVYFASDRGGSWDIWSRPTEGGAASRVTTGGGFLAMESPDGNDLFFARLDRPGIWRQPTGGGESELVVAELGLSDWGNWAVSRRGVYYVTRAPTTIRFEPFDGGPAREVHTPRDQIPLLARTLSLSNDGKALWFSLIPHSDDEVVRVDLTSHWPENR